MIAAKTAGSAAGFIQRGEIMGKFLTDLNVKKISEHEWRLIDPLVYNSNTVGVIVVPEGFITNFGSVPRFPLVYLLFGGVGDKACTVHDWLYTKPHRVIAESGKQVARCTADKIMRGVIYECLRGDDETIAGILKNMLSLAAAWAMWAGVRIGGWSHWSKK